jgi:hypothetical protein
MTQQQNNQDNSDWTDESEKIEADMWAYNQGIDGEMIHWIWEKAGSKAEFYDLCHKELNYRPVCNYTEEMKEIICSIFD